MSDDWARPTSGGDRRSVSPDDVIDITLTGPDGSTAGPRTDGAGADSDLGAPDEPNWRRIVGISSIIGVVLGVLVAVVLLDRDDGAEPTTETVAPDESSARITTPPTLPPVDEVDEALGGDAPTTTERPPLGPPGDPPEALVPPTYPPSPEQGTLELGGFDLDRAVARADDDRPRRASTATFGGDGRVLRFGRDGARDPGRDRYSITDRIGNTASTLVIDLDEGVVYQTINAPDTSWFARPLDEVEAGLGFPASELAERYLDPPIDPAWYDSQPVVAGDLVVLPDGTLVRQYVMTVDSAAAADRFENGASPRRAAPIPVELNFYVTGDDDLVLIEGLVHDGQEWSLLVHQVELFPPDAEVIELPDPDLVSGGTRGG